MRLEAAESVTEGHPDKVADQISDSLLDAFLAVDASSRVAVETLVTTGAIHVVGQVNVLGHADIPRVVRDRILAIGYDSSAKGLDGRSCSVQVGIDAQSPDIAQGVDEAFEYRLRGHGDPRDLQGAGDQGVMYGYACKETAELMPLPISIAHRLTSTLAQVRHDGTLPYLGPDGKAQVTIDYAGQTPRLDTVVVSTQHVAGISVSGTLAPAIRRHVFDPAIAPFKVDTREVELLVNPTGRFEIGGPMGDTGLTGRKIIVDTYGGRARHGGGAFSGKDPSKVDRSAAYAARWVAKHVVAAGLATQCEVQISYAIGKAAPVSLAIDCFGTEMTPLGRLQRAIEETFDLRPAAIIADLDLLRPIYAPTATYGHFGRESPNFTWERLDRVETLRGAVGT